MKRHIIAAAVSFIIISGMLTARAIDVELCGVQAMGEIRGGTSYLPLRALFAITGGELTWDAASRTAQLSSEHLGVTARDGDMYITANGRALYAPESVYISEGRIMIPCRAAAACLGGEALWDGETRSVHISSGGFIESGSARYDAEDLYWLSRIISAEARGEPFTGQIAVGNVVLNRVDSREFPNTVREVVFDRKYGVQFEPVLNGTVYDAPTESSVAAAKLCLEGVQAAGKALYFYDPLIAQSGWIGSNRPYAMTIGSHDFYY